MKRILIPSVLAIVGIVGVVHVASMGRHIDELRTLRRVNQDQLVSVREELAEVQRTLDDTKQQLQEDGRFEEVKGRLASVETLVHDAEQDLVLQEDRLQRWEDWADREPAEIDRRLLSLSDSMRKHWRTLSMVASNVDRHETEGSAELEDLRRAFELRRDNEQMWTDLVGPTVQLAGENTVGSGVLLSSRPEDGVPGYRTYLLTAWHVVRDIYSEPRAKDRPVPVKIYRRDGTTEHRGAELLTYDVELDAALLAIQSERPLETGAAIATRDRLRAVSVFDTVYAVGCPLGNDPIPTHGEVADTNHVVDGQGYWMISAPTYIGNSGGGIFDANTHELLGIFSKIYTHGSMRTTIVPHMGLVTPLDKIYRWLERTSYAHVTQGVDGAGLRPAAASPED